MRSPTTGRGLLGDFPCGGDPPAFGQLALPPPVWSPTSLSLWEILAARAGAGAGAGVGGALGGAGRRNILRDSGGGGKGARGKIQGQRRSEARQGEGGDGEEGGDRDNVGEGER